MAAQILAKQQLELLAVMGYGGNVPNGLLCHPDGVHMIYPLGSTIVVKNLQKGTQTFLKGHSNSISCIRLSHDLTKLASGQVTHMGFLADAIIWDFTKAAARAAGGEAVDDEDIIIHRLSQHKVKVQDLDFSPNDKFIATIGGQDDNNLLLWSVETGRCLCGTPAANDSSKFVRFYNNDNDRLITGGNYNLRVWDYGKETRKLVPVDVTMGQLQRVHMSIAIADDDSTAYVGTMTGDLFMINLRPKVPKFMKASKEKFSQGIRCIQPAGRGVLVGTGGGVIAGLGQKLSTVCKANVMGTVSSIAPCYDDAGDLTGFFCGTSKSNVYYCAWNSSAVSKTINPVLRSTCHFSSITGVCFPRGYSRVFITCASNTIRVWNAAERRELLRIEVPNLTCNCVDLSADGSMIISGWSDGKVRAFLPESGTLKFVIHDAHPNGVSAVAATNDCQRIISGGKDGRVRMWNARTQVMLASLKEHKAEVSSIRVRANDEECVSASCDGSCIVWDLKRYTRNNAMFASTLFRDIRYHPDESQMLTCGSDRKLTYFDSFDGNPIRIMEGSAAEINALDINDTGSMFVSAGNDRAVRVWDYDEGICHSVGEGHSGNINKVCISPDQQTIVSVGSEGAIFVWKMPVSPNTEGGEGGKDGK